MYAKYKPIQVVNNKGIMLNLVFENLGDENIVLAWDQDYCSITILSNGKMVDPRVPSKAQFKVMTEGIYRRDGKIVKKGATKSVTMIIDKVVDVSKRKSPRDKDVLVKPTESTYGIRFICMGFIFLDEQSTNEYPEEPIYFVMESNIFHVKYKKLFP